MLELRFETPMDRQHFDEPQMVMIKAKSLIPFLNRDKDTGKVVRTGGPISNPPKSTTDV